MSRKNFGPDEVWEFEPGTVVVNVVCTNARIAKLPKGRKYDRYCVIILVVLQRPDNARVFEETMIVDSAESRAEATDLAKTHGTLVPYAFNRRLVRNLSRESLARLKELQ